MVPPIGGVESEREVLEETLWNGRNVLCVGFYGGVYIFIKTN